VSALCTYCSYYFFDCCSCCRRATAVRSAVACNEPERRSAHRVLTRLPQASNPHPHPHGEEYPLHFHLPVAGEVTTPEAQAQEKPAGMEPN